MGICNDEICNCALRSSTLTVSGSGTPGDPWILEQAEFSDITELENDVANIQAVLATLGATYVDTVGDTMTGLLRINVASGGSLDLRATGDAPSLAVTRQDGVRLGFIQGVDSTSLFRMFADTGVGLTLGTGASERVRITSTGDVLVGKTAVDNSVDGQELRPSGVINGCVSTINTPNMNLNRQGAADANAQQFVRFTSASTTIGSITRATASTVAYNTSSDEEKKQNIRPVPDVQALALMRQIEPFLFEWRVSPNDATIGYVAQRVAAMWPEAIKHGLVTPPDPDVPVGDPRYGWQMDYSKIVPLLHSAMQAMDRRFEAFRTAAQTQAAQLQTQVTALTARVTALENA